MKYPNKYVLTTFALWLASFIIYLNYYDILIPGLPNGSYRLAIGELFAIPVFLLSVGQVVIGAVMIFASVNLFRKKPNMAKSLFISSFMVFLFSLTYIIFPMFGPFYYIVFVTADAPSYVLGIEMAWTAVTLVISTISIAKLNGLKTCDALFTAIMATIFIIVAAS